MDSECEDVTEEIVAYLWDNCSWATQNEFSTRIDDNLQAAKCGRVVGTGRELLGSGTYVVETAVEDCDKAEQIIWRVCEQMKLEDFEIVRPD